MGKIYEHNTPESAVVDPLWSADVSNVIKNKLGWNGAALHITANTLNIKVGSTIRLNANSVSSNVFVVSSHTGFGMKVNQNAPTYPWVDLLGYVQRDEAGGSNRPTMTKFKGNVQMFQFALNDQCFNVFHIPHDYVPGSDIYFHVHWAANTVVANSQTGVTFTCEATYAKGHGQQAFSNNVTVSVSNTYHGKYVHMISETKLSANNGTGGKLISNHLEPDGVILTRTALTTNNMGVNPFVFYVDLHYQSTNIGTKNKSPNFYN